MGRNKLLLHLGGETVVHRAVRTASEAGLDPVVAVLGHQADQVRAELDGLSCRAVWNPHHAQGVSTSLKAGIAALLGEVPAIVVILADMPFVTAEMIAILVDHYRNSRPRLVLSRYGEIDAPPVCYDESLFPELLAEPDERCAKRVIRRHLDQAVVVRWPEAALRDIDVLEDYEHVRTQVSGD
jgi:molybdenum cofactor cytidylyltransferase